MSKSISISAIVPVFNEEKNIKPLYLGLVKGLSEAGGKYEIIFVNDGSSDGSMRILRELYEENDKVSVISFDRNYGKTAALGAGVRISQGRLIVVLDSDLQHDPNEIPKLVKKIDQGFDVVVGWRKKRRDPLPRIIFSRIVNFFVFLLTGFKAHDFYSGFKCYRRRVVEELDLYGDLFRFIAYLAYKRDFKVCEVPITYHYRRFGKSKYGFGLFKRAIHDILIFLFVIKSFQKGYCQVKEVLPRRWS